MPDRDTLVKILNLARWAPSGDNTQPWRFEIVSEGRIVVHGHDTRDSVLYDFDGRPSQLAHGALLETLRIAASGFGCVASWTLRPGCADAFPVYEVVVERIAAVVEDPLLPFIEARVVQRRPMRMTTLTALQRKALAASPGPGYKLRFFESAGERWSIAKLLWANAHVRLTCPEAFEVHREIIEWGTQYSKDRIPEQAVGVDPLTARLMRWVMHSWGRVDFFNRYLLGTIAPRVQLDLLPALCCGAHLALVADRSPVDIVDHVEAGSAMQRLWLTATSVGLHLQPEMTPVIFNWYARAGRPISAVPELNLTVGQLAHRIAGLFGEEASGRLVFMGRVGVSSRPQSRSMRRELAELMVSCAPERRA